MGERCCGSSDRSSIERKKSPRKTCKPAHDVPATPASPDEMSFLLTKRRYAVRIALDRPYCIRRERHDGKEPAAHVFCCWVSFSQYVSERAPKVNAAAAAVNTE
jgi:hypothetical protein